MDNIVRKKALEGEARGKAIGRVDSREGEEKPQPKIISGKEM